MAKLKFICYNTNRGRNIGEKAISIALFLTLILNQVGAKCLADKTTESKSITVQAEMQPNGDPQQNEGSVQHVVELAITEMQKCEDKEKSQNKSSLLVRTLKWFGKAGVFVCKQFLLLITGSTMALVGSVATTYAIFSYGFAGVKSSLEEMNKLIDHLKENPELRDGILNSMFSLFESCKKRMQPDEFEKLLKQILMLFHPDKLKNLRNITKEKAEEIYLLAAELKDKV